MNRYTKELQLELETCGKLPMFEIEVNNKFCETDFLIYHIEFEGNCIVAKRYDVSTEELKSEHRSSSKIEVDSAFSLDEHLENLYTEVLNDIHAGDLFTVN